MKIRFVLCCAVLFFGVTAFAQDAVKVDPAHYKVEFENAKVRVLRFHYGPGEKSVMHSHPDSVAVFLTDGKIKFHLPDGKSQDAVGKAGETQFTPAQVHLPENTGDAAMEGIVVELKGKIGRKRIRNRVPHPSFAFSAKEDGDFDFDPARSAKPGAPSFARCLRKVGFHKRQSLGLFDSDPLANSPTR